MQHGRPERLPTISIHALRKESDRTIIHDADNFPGFQSTLSVRRVTARLVGVIQLQCISIHALRKESDHRIRMERGRIGHFNPRSP